MGLNFIFWFGLLLGGILIIVGRIMLAYPPKKINYIYGYRTPASMKTQERWDFAQVISSHAMFWVGLSTAVFGALISFLPFPDIASVFTIIGWNIISFIVLFFYVEKKINHEFGENDI